MSEAYPDDTTSAAVIGCGPVGLMAILAAQAQGAEKVKMTLILHENRCCIQVLFEDSFLSVHHCSKVFHDLLIWLVVERHLYMSVAQLQTRCR